MKTSIVSTIIGTVIKEVRIMSFYNNNRLVSDIVLVYLNVSSGTWYHFSTIDGVNTIRVLDEEPMILGLEEIKDEFAYPIRSVKLGYEGKKIIGIKQYSWHGLVDELCGFYIELEDHTGFSIFENPNEEVVIFNGIKGDENYLLM